MELQFQQMPFSYLQCVLRKCGTEEESVEIIVPDRLPDVDRILNVKACACMREKECRQGSATVSGGIRAVALYISDTNATPQKLEAYLPFSVRVDHSDISENSDVMFSVSVASVEAKIINSRKINLRISITYCVRVFSAAVDDLYHCDQMPSGFQIRSSDYSLALPAAYAERSFVVTDGLMLPTAELSSDNVIFVNSSAEITEKRIAGNKAVFKGTVDCAAFYLTDDGRISMQSLQIPFSQFCELPQSFDDVATLATAVAISDCSWETVSNPNSLEVNVNLAVQCLVSNPIAFAVVNDAYCLNCDFEPQWKQYAFDTRLDLQSQTDAVRAFFEADAREVLDADVFLGTPIVERETDLAIIRVPSTAEIVYRDEDNQLQSGRIRYESRFTCEICDNAKLEPEAVICGGVSAVPTGSGIEVRYSVCLTCDVMARWTQNAIIGGNTLEREAPENRPQLIAKRVDGRQDLWSIAKAYNTTVDRIRSMNHLSDEWFADGVLLIPTERK